MPHEPRRLLADDEYVRRSEPHAAWVDFFDVDGDGEQVNEAGPSMQQQVMNALAAHEGWKRRLHDAISTRSAEITVEQASVDDACAFGKWLHNDVPWRVRKGWDYANVRKLHAAFHVEAGRVLALALAGQSEAAISSMSVGSQFHTCSERLAYALHDWHGRVDDQAAGRRA